MVISFVGATGVLCTLGGVISEATGRRVAALARGARALEGVGEVIPSYTSVLVRAYGSYADVYVNGVECFVKPFPSLRSLIKSVALTERSSLPNSIGWNS